MACPRTLIDLPCNMSGVGYTSAVFDAGDNTLQLMNSNGANFPEVPAGQHYYVRLVSACGDCCTELRVTARAGDLLTVENLNTSNCPCIGTNATVRFSENSRYAIEDIIREMGINVQPPFKYDCATRTLSIDCATMDAKCAPCGT